MIVSRNEFSSLTKNFFKASQHCYGNYDDPIHSIFWLEANGFSGIQTLEELLENNIYQAKKPFIKSPKDTPSIDIYNCQNQCLLTIESFIADAIHCQLQHKPSIKLKLHHCRSQTPIIHTIEKLALEGITSIAFWKNESDKSRINAALKPHSSDQLYFLKRIRQPHLKKEVPKAHSVTLLCHKKLALNDVIQIHKREEVKFFNAIEKLVVTHAPITTSGTANQINFKIDLSNLPGGVYLLNISGRNI